MKGRPLVIRADASSAIGTGHMMRCLALAHAWRTNTGGPVVFVTVPDGRALVDAVRAAGFAVEEIAPGTNDAIAVEATVRSRPRARVVFDGYRFDAETTRAVRRYAKVLVIDDVAHRERYDADWILNQNAFASESMYRGRSDSHLLLGPRFALLRPEFRRPRRTSSSEQAGQGDRLRVLVTVGGSDPDNLTSRILDMLDRSSARLTVRVIAGPANAFLDQLRSRTNGTAELELVVAPDDMAAQMHWAEVAVSAAGSTIWELLHLGVPSLLLTVADNQGANAASVACSGAAVDLGWPDSGLESRFLEQLGRLATDERARRAMSIAGRELVDGDGASRVVAALSEEDRP